MKTWVRKLFKGGNYWRKYGRSYAAKSPSEEVFTLQTIKILHSQVPTSIKTSRETKKMFFLTFLIDKQQMDLCHQVDSFNFLHQTTAHLKNTKRGQTKLKINCT